MPLFTITMKSNGSTNEKDRLSRAIHTASIAAGYPEDDLFQRFLSLGPSDLRVGRWKPPGSFPSELHSEVPGRMASRSDGGSCRRDLLNQMVALKLTTPPFRLASDSFIGPVLVGAHQYRPYTSGCLHSRNDTSNYLQIVRT
jgi:hypothetical protein